MQPIYYSLVDNFQWVLALLIILPAYTHIVDYLGDLVRFIHGV